MSVAECVLDLNFVVDSSGSIEYKGAGNWQKALKFVEDVINQFTIGPNDVHVALVLFSTRATVRWGLTQYRDKNALINAVRAVPYLGNHTNLHDALYLTRTQVFGPGGGARSNSIKVTVILTDGEDNIPVLGTPLTIQNATASKNAGIQLIAVGVSNEVNRARLESIVTPPSSLNYHGVDDFDALTSVVQQLRPHGICGSSIALHFTCCIHNIHSGIDVELAVEMRVFSARFP